MAIYAEKFHWADYLLFAASLALTVGIGIFFAVRDKWHKQSAESYLMANRQMNWFLVGMSFLATAMSALLFVGISAEFYYNGIVFAWVAIAYYLGALFTMIIVIPKFYTIGFEVTSAYEYFEHRFNLPVRIVVGLFYTLVQLLYMGVALYIPSLVMSQVSELSLYWSIALGAIVCLIYTGFGGMKAVIWVDNIQLLIVAVGMTLLAGKGTVDAGGMTKVWEAYGEIGERNNWKDLSPDPWNRHTIWNLIFLMGINLAAAFATPQSLLQRYMTVPNLRKSQWSILIGITVAIPFLAIVCFIAIAAFATVGGNEPLLTQKIDSADQILPYFLMYLLGEFHGIPGLVVAALFAAALSTLSSGQNALVAVILEDFIRPLHRIRTGKELSSKASGILSRVLGVVVGIVVLLLALVIPLLDDGLLETALSIQSFITGPMMGLILAAFFCFWVESWGAFIGFLGSVAWAMMLYFGAAEYSSGIGSDSPPLFLANFSQRVDLPKPTAEPGFFDVSYTWYVLLDVLVVIVLATPISLIVHCCKNGNLSRSEMMPPKHLRYTTEDFLIAMGCKKEPKKAPQKYEEDDDGQKKDDEKPTAVNNDIIIVNGGQDNKAYLHDNSIKYNTQSAMYTFSSSQPAVTNPYISSINL